MRKFIYLSIYLSIISACTKQFEFSNTPDPKVDFQDIEVEPLLGREPLTGPEILAIATRIQESGEEFTWGKVDVFTLWSAVVRGDSTVAVGFSNNAALGLHNKQQTTDYLLEYTKAAIKYKGVAANLKRKEFITINTVVIKIADYETIGKLRQLPFVRYVEPWGFSLEAYMDFPGGRVQSGSGCSNNGIDNSPLGYTLFPGYFSVVSWHLTAHKVDAAWAYGAGAGVTIGVIDTGINGDQWLLTPGGFSRGPSAPRTIELITNEEDCAHGTTVTGMIAGPVNNEMAITGVAYRANVKAYKAGDGVLLNDAYEKQALANALDMFAADPQVKVINISMGYFFANSTVWDALVGAKTNNKLVVCSAGSTALFGWGTGIYPAKHSNTLAVTGVKYDPAGDPLGKNLSTFGGNYNGGFVDFCTYLERTADNRKGLGMHDDTYDKVKAKGSSAAAALVSGIAALVWEQNPNLSRDAVINILKNAASIYTYYGTEDAQYGWGGN